MTPTQPAEQTAGIGDNVVDKLAGLLRKAAPLAALVNSDEHTEEDHERLRALVGRADYVALTVNLAQLKSAATPCCCNALRDPRSDTPKLGGSGIAGDEEEL